MSFKDHIKEVLRSIAPVRLLKFCVQTSQFDYIYLFIAGAENILFEAFPFLPFSWGKVCSQIWFMGLILGVALANKAFQSDSSFYILWRIIYALFLMIGLIVSTASLICTRRLLWILSLSVKLLAYGALFYKLKYKS